MGNMKYKVGDKVRIKSLDWYNKNKDEFGNVRYKRDNSPYLDYFTKCMSNFCGKILTIKSVLKNSYYMNETSSCEFWTDEMIEGLMEEDIIDIDELQDGDEIIDIIDEYVHRLKGNECQINLPEGYVFKDENGNVINTNKIVLEKIKKEYPKTYKECLAILNYNMGRVSGYKASLLAGLQDLLVCRNAYWKIAGEEMGLEKPWEPDWTNFDQLKYCIWVDVGDIILNEGCRCQHILTFPTKEMRDDFSENFKKEIEQCKELL